MARTPNLLKNTPRQSLLREEGLRPLTAAEARHLGKPNTRLYTTQRPGIKLSSLKLDKTVPRRRAEQSIALDTTYEKLAKQKRIARGGFAPTDRFGKAVASYQEITALNDGTVRTKKDIRSDPEFKKLYKDSINPKRTKRAKRRRLQALHDLGLMDDDRFSELFQHYILEE